MAGNKNSGRRKGSKNYTYLDDGSIVNQFGVRFTPEEQKQIKSLNRKANYQRKKRLEELKTNSPNAFTNYKDFGVESDFFYRKKANSFNTSHFASGKAKERYLTSLKSVASGQWLVDKQTQYFRNYKQAIKNVFGEDSPEAKKLINKMNRMGIKKFAQKVENDEIKSLNMFDSKNRDDLDERFEDMAEDLGIDLSEE